MRDAKCPRLLAEHKSSAITLGMCKGIVSGLCETVQKLVTWAHKSLQAEAIPTYESLQTEAIPTYKSLQTEAIPTYKSLQTEAIPTYKSLQTEAK